MDGLDIWRLTPILPNLTMSLLLQCILTTGSRDDGVGILGVGGDLGDPAIVADQSSTQLQCLRHT